MIPCHYLRGSLLFQQKRYRLAAEEFRLQLGLVAGDSVTHGMLALALSELNDHGQATIHAREAIHLAPDQSFGYSVLAQVLIGRGRLDDAREAILEAVRIHPQNADYWGVLASIQLDKGQFREALESSNRGLECHPEHSFCINMRGLALANLGDSTAAAATMSQALAQRPDHAHTHASQGWALLRQSKITQALEHFRESLRIDPDLGWARSGLIEGMKSRNLIYRKFLGRSTIAPMFNLMLRLDRFGRHLLSADQIRGTNVTAAFLVAVLTCVICAVVVRSPIFVYLTVMLGLLSLVAAAIYECRAGWPRTTMTAITLALLALVVGLPLVHRLTGMANDVPLEAALVGCGFVLFWLLVGSRIAANYLIRVNPRK